MTQQGFNPGLCLMQRSDPASCAVGGHGGASGALGAGDAMADRLAGSLERSALSDEAAIRRRRVSAILRAVEREVVPRLLSTHAARPPSLAAHAAALATEGPARGTGGADNDGVPPGKTGPRVAPDAVLALVGALLGPDPEAAAAACVAACRAQGVPVETICLELLSGAARHLGDLWVEDRCSFTEVTLAAVQLHRLLHALAPGGQDGTGETAPDGGAGRGDGTGATGLALLVAAPGEQHSLGLSMLSDFFRGAGWQVQNPSIAGTADAARVVAARPVDLIGFSLGAEVHFGRLALCVAAVRRASRNRGIIVMVGGPAFLDRPELAIRIGADDTAPDAAEAVRRAAALLAARRGPRPARRASTAQPR